jgi:catechol 2,3-dioxygenase-like lactoylglutathione lyase family enzyme
MTMPEFAGVDHISLTVTDLDRSESFYTSLFELVRLADFGVARILAHRPTSFMLAIVRHDEGSGVPFSELHTGVDHIGFAASSRDELVAWERRFDDLGVAYTPIRDMEFGHHLNFRDPDNIALEICASNAVATAWVAELRERDIPREEIDARISAHLAALEAT